ncbi:hypothetical protein CANCADRAFT_92617 [Tortispora caseinolytica NRRL Y-17796]|uniref:Something about silencing protein 4 domain-containing protein n=1 Tax=Tortispora caseinolytica NRRL Y-17796 TaxID=767744 RepID=A0A1E4TLW9_9ASCO|nr:hypothetical protein CANCADRAFT_92617 [Tortispora caseinolytica NRRL Y-17796]
MSGILQVLSRLARASSKDEPRKRTPNKDESTDSDTQESTAPVLPLTFDEKLQIVERRPYNSIKRTVKRPQFLLASPPDSVVTAFQQGLAATVSDPLTDELYASRHWIISRSEKHLLNIERERIAFDIHKLRTQLEGLTSDDWRRFVNSMQPATHPDDYEQVQQALIRDTAASISRYDTYKRKEQQLKENLKQQREQRQQAAQETKRRRISQPKSKTTLPNRPFVSFYKNKSLFVPLKERKRRRGRHQYAFGHPVAVPEHFTEFSLPDSLRE